MNAHATPPDLSFRVEGAEAVPFAASPTLALALRIDATEDVAIHSVLLRCQINLEVTRRPYNGREQEKLFELFGRPQDWGRTLRSMLWTHASVSVPGFTGGRTVELPVACTYDFNVAAVKYFDALEDGEIPLCLLFNGTIFYAGGVAALQVAQIPWEKEASYRLPVRVWRELMDRYHPNTAWLDLRKDVFDRLLEYKRQSGHVDWDRTIESLLPPDADAGGVSPQAPEEAARLRNGSGPP
jgi:hypothetical protein